MAKKIFDKPPEQRLYFFLKTLIQSFNPESYHDLSNRPLGSAVKYLFGILVVSSLIFAVLITINLVSIHSNLNKELTKLDSLKVICELREPIIIDKHDIVIANEKNYTDENLLITSREISRKPLLCAILSPTCIFKNEPIKTNYRNLGKNPDDLGNFLFIIFILMFPGLLLLYLLYSLIKTLIIIFIMSLIAYSIIKAVKLKMKFRQILLCALYSSTIVLLAEPFNIILWNLYYIHIIIFIIIFIISVLLISERKYRYKNA